MQSKPLQNITNNGDTDDTVVILMIHHSYQQIKIG